MAHYHRNDHMSNNQVAHFNRNNNPSFWLTITGTVMCHAGNWLSYAGMAGQYLPLPDTFITQSKVAHFPRNHWLTITGISGSLSSGISNVNKITDLLGQFCQPVYLCHNVSVFIEVII